MVSSSPASDCSVGKSWLMCCTTSRSGWKMIVTWLSRFLGYSLEVDLWSIYTTWSSGSVLGRTASIAVWTSGGKETLRSALSTISSLSWGGPRKGTPSPPPTSPMLTSTRLGTSLQVRTVVTTQGRSCFQLNPNPPSPNYFPFYKQPFSFPVASWSPCLSHLQQR